MTIFTIPNESHLPLAPLVDLMQVAQAAAANLTFDIKYASTDNFTGQMVYPQARCFIMKEAAQALLNVAVDLKPHGYGLRIFDAYRPWYVTAYFWEHYPDSHLYLADPAEGSRHNRGCAVDLSLYDLKTGQEIEMPSAYDEFNEKSHLNYMGGTAAQNAMRDVLQNAMHAHRFSSHPHEWWHFDYENWHNYRVRDDEFEQLI
ncbi:M15 family metallopeptidase [Hydromonas duriensis]|uniref:D-alanyl-D-alanine dipeptidase n=1 Tax=Hydromonas duriensis TaxID=1527608 RepID=A0A4R6Y7G8_9BURK|nr:M15 family metallopeptidase [Hydromonas duriensis]TDR31267.1 D-alanyl-D-alanine dipeptidase [Hydromonas duriensis]